MLLWTGEVLWWRGKVAMVEREGSHGGQGRCHVAGKVLWWKGKVLWWTGNVVIVNRCHDGQGRRCDGRC